MKNLIVIALVFIAGVISALNAYAADSAALNLGVTFDVVPALKIWADPEGPFSVKEGELLVFRIEIGPTQPIDSYAMQITYTAENLPYGASLYKNVFSWTPAIGQAGDLPYNISFLIKYDSPAFGSGELRLDAAITVLTVEKVIAIELNEAAWQLEGVKLGEKRGNFGPDGVSMHIIKNTGNIGAMLDIGYVPMPEYIIGHNGERKLMVKPDYVPGFDKFATEVVCGDGTWQIIPPEGKIKLATILPGESKDTYADYQMYGYHSYGSFDLRIGYMSPTRLSEGIAGMNAIYEIRAYPVSE